MVDKLTNSIQIGHINNIRTHTQANELTQSRWIKSNKKLIIQNVSSLFVKPYEQMKPITGPKSIEELNEFVCAFVLLTIFGWKIDNDGRINWDFLIGNFKKKNIGFLKMLQQQIKQNDAKILKTIVVMWYLNQVKSNCIFWKINEQDQAIMYLFILCFMFYVICF